MLIIVVLNMLWLEAVTIFADILWQKPNITRVAIENIRVLPILHIRYEYRKVFSGLIYPESLESTRIKSSKNFPHF